MRGLKIKTFEELPLVLQLQHLAQKTDSDIEELLRKAKLVAMKLNLSDFENWCESELMGYTCDIDKLPQYRITSGRLYAYNPHKGLVPFYLQDDEVYKLITTVRLTESIGEYVNLISKETNGIAIQLHKHQLDFLYDAQYKINRFAFEPKLTIEVTQVMRVLTYVRNSIFNWSLNLEKSGILGDGIQFTCEEKQKAMTTTNYNIGFMQGVAGQVQDSSVTQTYQMINNQIDLSTLLNLLRSQGINEADLNDLQDSIATDKKPMAKDVFGEKVSHWYGRMIAKAADGSWQIGIGTAANVLAQSLNSFYGLS